VKERGGGLAFDSLVEVAERLLRLVVRRPRFIFEILIVGRIIEVTAVRSFKFADGVLGDGRSTHCEPHGRGQHQGRSQPHRDYIQSRT
jgi:hypothetical protein